MRSELRRRVRRDLDEELRVFRGNKVRRSKWGWLRGVRQALGMRVAEVAWRLKMGKSEVYRLEMSEARETITLKKLRATAEAMGCELVYAVVPGRERWRIWPGHWKRSEGSISAAGGRGSRETTPTGS